MKEAAVVALLLFAGLQTQIGNVEGIVRDPSGGPLRGAMIRLTTLRPGETRPTIFSTTTDAQGRFRMMAPPASYTVTVQRDGYLGPTLFGIPQPVITANLVVTSEQTPPILNFDLTPSGTIAGRLLDSANRPAILVEVAAMQNRYREGRASMVQVGTATTNERGEYRITGLASGEYVVAFNPAFGAVAGRMILTPANRQSAQTRTFYPGTSDLGKATALRLEPSEEIHGVDFAILATEVVTISGVIAGPLPSPDSRSQSSPSVPTVTLVPRESALASVMSSFPNVLPPQARREGYFEFRGIPAGSYDLYASVPSSAGEQGVAGHIAVDITSQDVRNISIPVHPLSELRGRVIQEKEFLPDQTKVRISPDDGRMTPPIEVGVDQGGEFTFRNLQSGRYRLGLILPPNVFLADFRQGQQRKYGDNSIQLNDDSIEPVQFVLGTNALSVDGTVVAPVGKPLTDTTVVLVPETSLRGNFILYRTARSGESGQFALKNVAPGTYKVFAWEGVLDSAWLNADFLAKYEELGSVIAVESSAISGIRVNAIPLQ